MSITATEIQNIRFSEARRGYNPDEVDEFLERVASDVDTLNRALAEAAARVSAAEERASNVEERSATSVVSTNDQTPVPSIAGTVSDDVISRAFIAAQISADNIKEEARKEAEKLYREAEAKAKDFISDAYNDRERMLSEIEYLRGISERFRTEFLSLVNHYNTDAQKRFVEFADLVPEGSTGSGEPSIEAMLSENNAAVAPDDSTSAAENATTDKSMSTSTMNAVSSARRQQAGSTAPDDSRTTYALDDDLEIEEID